MKKTVLSCLLILVLAMALVFGACGNRAPREKRQTIGLLVKDATAEYIQAFMIGAQNYCDENNILLRIVDGGYDTMKFLDAINQFLVQGIDGFIIAAVEDPIAVVPGIWELNKRGIPVFALDTCPDGGHVEMFITFDIVESTVRACEQMIEGIKSANGGEVPAGVIIEITGALVDMFAQECMVGVKKVIDQYPQLRLVQGEGKWFNEDAFNRTADLLTRYGDEVVGIYCHTPDIMGSGTVAAVESLGRDPRNYFISGICLGSEGIELIKQGKLHAVVEQPALDSAVFAVKYLDDLYHGRPIPMIGDIITETGALWSPAYVVKNKYAASGATMILQGPLIPKDFSPDDPRLWENILFGSD